MLFRSIFLLSVASIAPIYAAAIPGYASGYKPSCLTSSEVKTILKEWEALWVNDFSKIDNVLAKDYEGFEYDYTEGKDVPFASGSKALQASIEITNDPTQSDTVGIREYTVFEFHTCDMIALRWEEVAKTSGLHEKETGIPAGKGVKFAGIDLLTIDLACKKISKSVTSQDLINYNNQIGFSEQPTK